jgi:GntR family transcriptional repressor for pyruvate dehydrogenase complex
MVEPPLAARAAKNASAGQIAAMEEILGRHAAKVDGGHLAIKEDSEFHYSIATASGNTIVLKVLDVVMDLLRETRSRSLQTRGRPEKSLAGHRRILSAIKQRDPAGAEEAMRLHITNIENIVLNKL